MLHLERKQNYVDVSFTGQEQNRWNKQTAKVASSCRKEKTSKMRIKSVFDSYGMKYFNLRLTAGNETDKQTMKKRKMKKTITI